MILQGLPAVPSGHLYTLSLSRSLKPSITFGLLAPKMLKQINNRFCTMPIKLLKKFWCRNRREVCNYVISLIALIYSSYLQDCFEKCSMMNNVNQYRSILLTFFRRINYSTWNYNSDVHSMHSRKRAIRKRKELDWVWFMD